MSRRFLNVCEAPADHETATTLADRVFVEEGPDWLRDFERGDLAAFRSWVGHEPTAPLVEWHELARIVAQLGVRTPHGKFSGEPGAPDALATRNALAVAREVQRRDGVDAVVLIRDADRVRDASGIEQAVAEFRALDERTPVVIGLACAKREAWLLAGFDARDDGERARLEGLRAELGFDPTREAHRLDAQPEHAKKSVKRVLRALVDEDRERERACLEEPSLAILRARGEGSRLTRYLDEVAEKLAPLLGSG